MYYTTPHSHFETVHGWETLPSRINECVVLMMYRVKGTRVELAACADTAMDLRVTGGSPPHPRPHPPALHSPKYRSITRALIDWWIDRRILTSPEGGSRGLKMDALYLSYKKWNCCLEGSREMETKKKKYLIKKDKLDRKRNK